MKTETQSPKKLIQTVSYLSPTGELSSSWKGTIPDDVLIKGYKMMVTTRHFDERMITLQRQGTISFCLSSFGEEACAVASAAALSPEDWMYPQYREAGVMFWRGYSMEDFVNHMFCNAKDNILGRQMPNHFGSKELNVVQVSSPIGTKIPHCAGCAYAMKIQKEKKVAICYFGEGATSEGDFHAGLNFAAVRKAPAIFFCRNNGYAISTPANEQFSSDGIAPKGEGYGIKTYRIDGNDFFAIYETIQKAREECLKGNGPILIEAMTYRMGAHSTSDDPSVYRTDKEVQEQQKHCPILRLRRYLEKKDLWDEKQENNLWKSVSDEVTRCIEIAKNTPPPSLKSLFENVYFEMPQQLQDQYQESKRFFAEGSLND
ncbi:MAG: thiamine pyrophosphate-dependent enzyme [Chlamydiota bacterium]|nr:thiamine pyrophosphate-dependent enzyme [Chlamydiota bacterium]